MKVTLKVNEIDRDASGITIENSFSFKKLFWPKSKREKIAAAIIMAIAEKCSFVFNRYIDIEVSSKELDFLKRVLENREHPEKLQKKRQVMAMRSDVKISGSLLLKEAKQFHSGDIGSNIVKELLVEDNFVVYELRTKMGVHVPTIGSVGRVWLDTYAYNGFRLLKLEKTDFWVSEEKYGYRSNVSSCPRFTKDRESARVYYKKKREEIEKDFFSSNTNTDHLRTDLVTISSNGARFVYNSYRKEYIRAIQ